MIDWQTIIATLIVLAAVFYILAKFLRPGHASDSCGSCSSCPKKSATKIYQLK